VLGLKKTLEALAPTEYDIVASEFPNYVGKTYSSKGGKYLLVADGEKKLNTEYEKR